MANAYFEKLARVNLTTGTVSVERLDPTLARKYVGGRGLGAKLLYDEGCATADPLGPDNKLIFATGPMTGTVAPASGRHMVVTKSPRSGMLACSNAGGVWGTKLKYAGWDGLIVEGEAPQWCYLYIADDSIRLLDARKYLGMPSDELEEALKEAHGRNASVLSIGIAGENRVLLSAIMIDADRGGGRSGIGAVMGSKKLKAVVVSASRKNAEHILASAEALQAVNEDVMARIRSQIAAAPGGKQHPVKTSACHRCPIICSRLSPGHPRPWLDTGYSSDPSAADMCSKLCNAYGLDAFSVPNTISAAMQLYQQGFIQNADCDGISLDAGDPGVLAQWIERIARPKTPLDRLMSAGSACLCAHYGLPDLSKKHRSAPKLDARPQSDTVVSANQLKNFHDMSAVIDSMGLCLFTASALELADYTKLLNAAWGTGYTPEEVLLLGERISSLERMFNKAAGMHPSDDRLPKRPLTEPSLPMPTLQEYYRARGWENGFPTEQTLRRLELTECLNK